MSRDEQLLRLRQAEGEFILLAADVESGRVPSDARRAMFPHEVRSGLSFLALNTDIESAAETITRRLGQNRARFLELLMDDLLALGSVDAIVARLQEAQLLGISTIPGAVELLQEQRVDMRALLETLARQGSLRVAAEAIAQGVDFPETPLSAAASSNLDIQATRAIAEPMSLALAAVATAIIARAPRDPDEAIEVGDAAGRALSEAALGRFSNAAASSADLLGRGDAALQGPEPLEIYASELLDRNTCGPCQRIDGRRYSSVEEALLDYQSGGYHLCEGLLLCRGTLVYIWPTEVRPRIDDGREGADPRLAPAPPPGERE